MQLPYYLDLRSSNVSLSSLSSALEYLMKFEFISQLQLRIYLSTLDVKTVMFLNILIVAFLKATLLPKTSSKVSRGLHLALPIIFNLLSGYLSFKLK